MPQFLLSDVWLSCFIIWYVSANWFPKSKKVCLCHICSYSKISFLQERCNPNPAVHNVSYMHLETRLLLLLGELRYLFFQNKKYMYSFFSRQFKRVLELPSENWLELAQDWCCHGKSHLTSVAGVLEPGEKDCFVGEYYVKLHSSTIQPSSLQLLPVSKKIINYFQWFME